MTAPGPVPDPQQLPRLGAAQLTATRKLLQQRYAGISEAESIAYARGFTRGLVAAGIAKDQIRALSMAYGLNDKMLEAGAAYLAQAMLESVQAKHAAGAN